MANCQLQLLLTKRRGQSLVHDLAKETALLLEGVYEGRSCGEQGEEGQLLPFRP